MGFFTREKWISSCLLHAANPLHKSNANAIRKHTQLYLTPARHVLRNVIPRFGCFLCCKHWLIQMLATAHFTYFSTLVKTTGHCMMVPSPYYILVAHFSPRSRLTLRCMGRTMYMYCGIEVPAAYYASTIWRLLVQAHHSPMSVRSIGQTHKSLK